MRITTSNVLLGVTPTVSSGASSDDPANANDPDFSTSYTGSDNNSLVIDFGAHSNINYLAVAGINIEGNKNYTSYVQVFNGSTLITTNQVIRNNCVMVMFDLRSFSNLRVKLYNAIGNLLPSVRFVAAGQYLQIPNGGEVGGYIRQFLNRNNTTKSTLSDLVAPVSRLTKKKVAKATLSLPNMTKEFTEVELQTFLDFTVDNYFFVAEQDLQGDITQNSSAYLCFDVSASVRASQSTRALNDVSINFQVFNGL